MQKKYVTNLLPAQKVGGLIDGMAVLQELAVSDHPVSGLELSKKLGLSPVRVNRLLKTFAYLGYTYRTESRKYVVGVGMHVLAAQSMAASGLLGRSFKYLEELVNEATTVALGVLWKDQICYLFHKSGKKSMGEGIGMHSLFPAKDSSVGVALLAELPDQRIESIYHGKPPAELLKKVAETRREGYGLMYNTKKNLPSCTVDHYSMAVCIGHPAYAGLAVSGMRDKDELPELLEHLRRYAALIEEESVS